MTKVLNQTAHIAPVALGVVDVRHVTLSLVPKHRLDLSTVSPTLLRSLNHRFVQTAPALPLFYRRPTDGARNQPDHVGIRVGSFPHRVGERHPRTYAAHFAGVDVGVERLTRFLPPEICSQAEDRRVRRAFRRDDFVPYPAVLVVVLDDAAASGHVALSGEDEDLVWGVWWVWWVVLDLR